MHLNPLPLRGVPLLLLPMAGTIACAQGAPEATSTEALAISPDSAVMLASENRVLGPEEAPVTIYEFSDFQCPFCREFEQSTFPGLKEAFVETGQAKIVFMNFPLPTHPSAWVSAEAALCAGVQGEFWAMHDRLFADQAEWADAARPGEVFERHAEEIGLDVDAFRACVRDDLVANLLIRDLTSAAQAGISGTPTFILVREPRPGEAPAASQRLISGARSVEDFRQAIGELME